MTSSDHGSGGPTTPPREDLDTAMVSGAKWTAAARWGSLLVTWPTTILLARLLTPQDFGYVALVAVFTRFASLMADGGLSATIVLGRELTETQYRRLHGWSMLFFAIACGVLLTAAVPIERLYDTPGIRWVVVALSASLTIDGIMLVPMARLRRAMRFRELAVISSVRVVVQAFVSIATAAAGLGYWALVAGHVSGVMTGAVMALRAYRMLPMLPRLSGLESVLATSGKLLIAGATTFIGKSSDAWIGGAVAGAGPLGGYTMMKGLAEAPLEKVSGIMDYVAGSVFGNLAGDPDRLRRLIIRLTRLTSLIMLPMFCGIALVAGDLVPGLLGSQWIPYIPALQVYCVYAAILTLTMSLGQGAVAADAARDVAGTGIMLMLILPPAFYVLGSAFGATGLALAWLFPVALTTERLIHALRGRIGLRRRDLLAAISRPLAAVGVMGLAVIAVGFLPGMHDAATLFRLGVRILTGVVTYAFLVFTFQKDDILWLTERAAPRVATRLHHLYARFDRSA